MTARWFILAAFATFSLPGAVLKPGPDSYAPMNCAHRNSNTERVLELEDSSGILSAATRSAGFPLLGTGRSGDSTVQVRLILVFPDGSEQVLGNVPELPLRNGRMLVRNFTLTLDDGDVKKLSAGESAFNLVSLRVRAEFSDAAGNTLPALNDVAAIGFDLGRNPSPPVAAVVTDSATGVPTLSIGGKLYPGIFGYVGWNWGTARQAVRDMGNAGRHLYEIVFQPWTLWKDGTFDEAAFERKLHTQVASIVAQDPKALIFVRWWLYVPRDWAKHNPGESIVYDDGTSEIPLLGGPWAHASYASKAWREAYTRIIKHAVRKLVAGPYADRIFMVRVGYGNCGEWNNFGYHQQKFPGFSPQMEGAYREWLGKRYGSIVKLNAAWQSSFSGRDGIAVPSREERLAGNPAVSGNVSDFYRFFNEYTVFLIEHFGKTVKEASDGRLLYGVFYGYFTHHLTGFPYHVLDSGHYAMGKLLASPVVDTVCSPYGYIDRNRNCSLGMPLESIRAHGKLFLAEMDLPTHLADPVRYSDATSASRFSQDEEGAMTLYRRDFGRVLAWGVGGYWYDFAHGWYDFDRFRKFERDTNRINREAAARDLRSVAEVALILDEESMFGISLHAGKWAEGVRDTILFDLDRLGVPSDVWLSSDLDAAAKRNYRLLIFPNLLRNDPAIANVLANYPGSVLFLGGPGTDSAAWYGASSRKIHESSPRLTAERWKAILKSARVHRYTDRDETFVYANASYLGVWIPAADGGTLSCTLPRPATVIDAETGQILGSGSGFRLPLPAGKPYFKLLRIDHSESERNFLR